MKSSISQTLWRNLEGNLCLAVVSLDSEGKLPLKESVFICSIPRPAYGGRDCPGSSFDYQMCNTEECAGPYEDFRAQQCIKRSNKYHNNIKHTWIPYEHPDGGCRASPMQRRLWRTLERPGSSNRLFFFHLQRPESVSWVANQRRRERWSSWTRWCTTGPAAATRTLSACAHVESVWWVLFNFRGHEKGDLVFPGCVELIYTYRLVSYLKTSSFIEVRRVQDRKNWRNEIWMVTWFGLTKSTSKSFFSKTDD